MSGSLGYRVPLPHCVNMVLAGLLAGTITPGQAGGEPVRVHELYRSGVKLGDAAAVVIMERVLDGVILTVMGVILMTLMTRFFWNSFSPALYLLVIIAWILMISFLIIPVLAIRYPEMTKRLLMKLVNWLVPKLSWWSSSPETLVELADREIDNLFVSMARFTGTCTGGAAWRRDHNRAFLGHRISGGFVYHDGPWARPGYYRIVFLPDPYRDH